MTNEPTATLALFPPGTMLVDGVTLHYRGALIVAVSGTQVFLTQSAVQVPLATLQRLDAQAAAEGETPEASANPVDVDAMLVELSFLRQRVAVLSGLADASDGSSGTAAEDDATTTQGGS